MSIPGGATLEAGGSHNLRPWRVLALFAGAVLACLATLVLTTLLASSRPSTHPLASHHALQSHTATRLPLSLAAAASTSIGASEHGFWPSRHGASLLTQGGGIRSTYTASGARLRMAQGTLGLSLAGVGRGQRLERIAAVAPSGAASQVLYRHGSITEFYRNGPSGLEQGFTLRHSPEAGTGPLVLALRIGGSLTPEQVGSQVLFRTRADATALHYGQLSALDATGRRLPAHIQISNGGIQLRIDDGHARYPVRIDPFVQQGGKLTGSGEVGAAGFSGSVALSYEGNTALVGGREDNGGVGAAWVFIRSGSTWIQQGGKLTGGGEIGKGGFGESVALSSDGNTALVSGSSDGSKGAGATWVFTRSGSTWTQQGEKLTGGGATGEYVNFGSSIALSSDGNTALISGTGDNTGSGAAWVFTRSGATWTQQGAKLTGAGEISPTDFGVFVALSDDGNTALIGGFGDNGHIGAAWVFTRSGSTWTQQGSKLTPTNEIGASYFGVSVALSSDGNTALIGGYEDNGGVGAVWVFTRSGSIWTEGPKLTATGEVGKGVFGISVALSGDGNTALIGEQDYGGPEQAWLFTRSGSTWTQLETLTGSGKVTNDLFGASLALSRDGTTALIGGPWDNSAVGAAWVFVNLAPPTVTKVKPNKGPVTGSTTVAITGINLTGATAVKFGSTNAASFFVNSATTITAFSPAEAAGTVDVTVTTPGGTSAISTKDHFKFLPTVTKLSPNSGSKAGGTSVTVTGTGFAPGTSATVFKFGTTKATSVTCETTTTCVVRSPAHAAGIVDVKATVSGMSSPKATADQFTYN